HTYTPSPFFFQSFSALRHLHSFPTRRSSDLTEDQARQPVVWKPYHEFEGKWVIGLTKRISFQKSHEHRGQQSPQNIQIPILRERSEEHTSELQSRSDLVCRLLLEKKKKTKTK